MATPQIDINDVIAALAERNATLTRDNAILTAQIKAYQRELDKLGEVNDGDQAHES